MKEQLRRRKNERGSSTTTVLIFASAIAVSSGVLVSQLKDNKKAAKQETEADIERRVNEAALQSVTQLISNGSLYFNAGCGIAEPQVNGAVAGYTKAGGCGSVKPTFNLSCSGGTVSWRYERRAPSPTVVCKAAQCETVDICVPTTRKNAAGLPEQIKVQVTVSFVEYKKDATASGNALAVERNFGYLRAQRGGHSTTGQFYSTLNAKVNFGASQDANKGLIGKHGAADTCFYMRPATVNQDAGNVGFAARSNAGNAYALNQLEPRPDGKLADEFERPFYPDKLSAKVTDADYAVLSTYRDTLINTYYKSNEKYRGAKPANDAWSTNANRWQPTSRGRYVSQNQIITNHLYSGTRANEYFVGVMPEKGAEGGPDFQYFLTGSRSRPTQWNQASAAEYKSGCGSAGTNADFCTKVYIPYKEHKASLNRKCIKESVSLSSVGQDTVEGANNPPPTVYYADRAVQVSCSAAWVDKVQALLAEEKIALDGRAAQDKVGRETTAEMAIAALEVDDDFLDGKGKWALNPSGKGGIHPLRAAYNSFVSETMTGTGYQAVDQYTVKYQSDKDVAVWSDDTSTKDGVTTTTRVSLSKTDGKPRNFSIYRIENLGNPIVANRHTSMTCAYFSYFNAANPTQCSYSYTTKDEAGFVCRNNDGCFDETTLIRMADGSDRLVTALRMGEFVYNPVTKMPARITKLTIGPELKPLINVSVGGRVVKVTDTHPFMTRRGWIQAKNLKRNDEVLSGNKVYIPVTAVELGASGRTVANLALEGPASSAELHYVLANGIVTGDLVIQNMLELKASSK